MMKGVLLSRIPKNVVQGERATLLEAVLQDVIELDRDDVAPLKQWPHNMQKIEGEREVRTWTYR